MQNNPFNLLSQLQSAAGTGNSSNTQGNSGQSTWSNAALMSAMQSMLSRGGPSTMPGPSGNVLSGMGQPSWTSKPHNTGTDSSVDMNVFRQFQLPQNQPVPPQVNSPPQRAGNVFGTAAGIPGWNSPQHATSPAPDAGSTAANNPLMNVLVQSFLSQQMAAMQQPQQPNPMMQFMQMMSMASMMPNMGALMPSMDPNMTKQLLVQLIGQLQQSGQLSSDDSLQKLVQQVSGEAASPSPGNINASPGNINASPAKVASVLPGGTEEQKADEARQAPGPASNKRQFRGGRVKAAGEAEDTGLKVKADAGFLQPSMKTPEGKGRFTKKQTDASFEDGKKTVRTPPAKPETKVPTGRRQVPQRKSIEAPKKASDLVMFDSEEDDDDDDNDTSTNPSITEKSKGKKGGVASQAKPQTRQTKKSTNVGSKVNQKGNKDSVLEFPLQRIKVEDVGESKGQSSRTGRAKLSVADKAAEINIVSQIKIEPDIKAVHVPLGVKLKRCEVRLERLKRDSNGRFTGPLNLKKATSGEKTMTFKAEPRSPVRSDPVLPRKKDDQPPPINVQLLPNLNAAVHPQMRTIFVGHRNGNMQWMSLVGWSASRSFCQCAFCPMLSDTPKPILSHIHTDHADLTFALTKMKPPPGKFLFLFCRHCDFVALDVTINWLHFEVYHNVSDILEGAARPRIEDFAPVKLEIRHGLEDVMDTSQSYMCYDCEMISDDSKQVAIHVLHEHPNTPHYNGCFVKLLGLRKPLKSERVSYKHIISDDEFTEFRQEAFICMMCEYIAHCPYMALSHNLITHQTKRVLFECMEAGCTFSCVTDAAMIQHLSSKHRLKADLCCSTTLLEPRVNGYVECVITVNRKSSKQASLQRCHTTGNDNANADGNADRVTTSSEESGNEDDVNDEDDEESKPKKRKSSRKPRGKTVKNSARNAVENGKGKEDVEESTDEEDQLPEDVKITINPPSPNDSNVSPGSPGSNNSGDTIVEDVPNPEDAANEEESLSHSAGDVSTQESPMDSGDVEKQSDTRNEKDNGTQPLSALGDETGGNGEEKAKDFVEDIPLEPCCLSPDIYLPVPNADICTFDSTSDVGRTDRPDMAELKQA